MSDAASILAPNPARLAEIKANLARNRMTEPLFNTALFARRLEAAFTAMHARQQAGLLPDHITVME